MNFRVTIEEVRPDQEGEPGCYAVLVGEKLLGFEPNEVNANLRAKVLREVISAAGKPTCHVCGEVIMRSGQSCAAHGYACEPDVEGDSQMAGNPKGSKWRSTPQAARKRKLSGFTLSDEAKERLSKLAEKHGVSQSAMVEALIMKEPLR
jgi:hypothetical protein